MTAWLRTLERPLSDFDAGAVWRQRDAGQVAVLAWMVDERLVGVMVLAVAEVKAGKVLDVVAIRFTPGSWTRKIDDFLAAMCRAGGCIGYRGYSPRPVNRLLDLEPLDAGWFRRVEHAQQ